MLRSLKFLLPVLILLTVTYTITADAHSQLVSDTTVSIRIESRMDINPSKLFVDILEKNGRVSITYNVISNVNLGDMLSDTAYQNAYKAHKMSKTSILPSLEFYKKYGSSAIDVISTTDKDLIELLTKLHASTIEEIERNEANKDRRLLDGADFYLVETLPRGIRQIRTESPDEKSHPLLYKIILRCGDIYKLKYPDKKTF